MVVDNHIIGNNRTAREALIQLERISNKKALVLFVKDSQNNKIIGSITDGDLRRGLISGLNLEDKVQDFMKKEFAFLKTSSKSYYNDFETYKKRNITIIPLLNNEKLLVKLIDLNVTKTILPVNVLLMAGGKGSRLRPYTLTTPKPLLKVGEKPIICHNIDWLNKHGIDNYNISIRYLGDKIIKSLRERYKGNIHFNFIKEEEPLGTAGALNLIDAKLNYEDTILMNSDLLTNLDFRGFYDCFKEKGLDLVVAAIPYTTKVPYAIFDLENGLITSLSEKPTYTYLANAGIYLMNERVRKLANSFKYLDATELIEQCLSNGFKVAPFEMKDFWLDIGNPMDYDKANQIIDSVNFK